ncbi:uncharacterized protein LOC143597102 [Bidens hawaiensis]|uniref:uncharacterized protein LOC143597102 n=1 Tax=Bidens hawaiensis TaxID=980011 RepID=UPI00404AF5B9
MQSRKNLLTTLRSEPKGVMARCFDLKCKWRIHAFLMQHGIIFEVKKLVDTHSCTRSNKAAATMATQGWVASVIIDKLKSDGDLAGFLDGCRPYISLDACHLKGRFNGVLVGATGVDGNNSIFPMAYGVLESENKKSWIWFLELLKKTIGTPNGLVISSDMQKDLDIAITQVYPTVEHKECVRHLYSNFKRHFRGEFFTRNLWHAARTYRLTEFERLLNEIGEVNNDALTYLNENHNRIWSRGKFGTTSKCDYITNNISEAFNYWIGEVRV